MRQIFLDTETTGLEAEQGHRIIEIGCVEMVNRRLTGKHFHCYINPEREIDDGASGVHGITNAALVDKPLFAQIADEFLAFVKGADLIIHNAPFDIGFLDAEFARLQRQDLKGMTDYCRVIDTLLIARQKHPGQRNSLDALCRRYEVDNAHRELHGALLDAEILAEVYLRMTGGQVGLALSGSSSPHHGDLLSGKPTSTIRRLPAQRKPLPVITANAEELAAHQKNLELIQKASGNRCLWMQEV
jgi:DNA polymerase-3 subunit epsilon